MRQKLKHYLLISIGWLCILLATIGVFLPLLPTTPFLILALGCFAESSPRFHKMLLNHKWFGPPLRQWEQSHTIRPHIKKKVYLIVIATFSVSILMLWGRVGLQLMLVGFCLVLLFFIRNIKESAPE